MAERKMSYAEVAGAPGGQISDDDLTLAESEMSEENTDLTMAVGEISDEETYQELIEKEMCEDKTELTLENEEKNELTLENEKKIELTLENEEIVEENPKLTLEVEKMCEEKIELTLENEEKNELTLENMEMCKEKNELALENGEICEEKTELTLENKEIVEKSQNNDISVKFKVILTEKELSEINTESTLAENVSEEPSSLLEQWATKWGKNSVPKQLVAGGVGGLLAGYLTGKAPKTVAVGVVGSLLLRRIAGHKGILNVNKKEISKDGETVKETTMEELKVTSKSGHCSFQEFAAKNVYVTGGFAGGFLVGVASSWK